MIQSRILTRSSEILLKIPLDAQLVKKEKLQKRIEKINYDQTPINKKRKMSNFTL